MFRVWWRRASSVAEATAIAQGLARKSAESCIEHGDQLPPALTHLQEPETGLDLLVPSACDARLTKNRSESTLRHVVVMARQMPSRMLATYG